MKRAPPERARSGQRTAWSCHGVYSRRAFPASSADRAGRGRAPGSGSSRRPTARWHALADRHRPTTSRSLSTNFGSLESLNCRQRCGCRPRAFQMRLTAPALMPIEAAFASAVQCVVSPGGSSSVSATTRSGTSGARGAMRDGRVLPCSSPPQSLPRRSVPANAKRRSWPCPCAA